jgi:hypothetical protein
MSEMIDNSLYNQLAKGDEMFVYMKYCGHYDSRGVYIPINFEKKMLHDTLSRNSIRRVIYVMGREVCVLKIILNTNPGFQ